MKRHQLEHILRAAGAITDSKEFIVIGSQAILGGLSEPPEALLVSEEVDLYVPDKPELSTLIDGTIGELSPFHQTFGYYGHGVGPETAILPLGWESRTCTLSIANTGGIVGRCLHPLDICYSKLAAGREKDIDYCRHVLQNEIVQKEELTALIDARGDSLGEHMLARIRRIGP